MPTLTRRARQNVLLRFIPGLLLVSIGLLTTSAQATPASQEAVPLPSVLRLLKCPNDCVKAMQLFVGQLPDHLPVSLPLPSNSKVVATLIRDREQAEIVLDAPQSPAQIKTFYRKTLKASGWKSQGYDQMVTPGFQASDDSNLTESSTYCQGNQGPELAIVAGKKGTEPTDVRLYLNTHAESCTSLAATTAEETRWQALLPMPSLVAPVGSQVVPAGFNGGENSLISSARITTPASGEVVFTAYADQLVQAGWQKQTISKAGQTTSSLWTLTDQKGQHWQATLNVSAIADQPGGYSASVVLFR